MPVSRPLQGVFASAAGDPVGAPVAPGVWATALPFPSPLKHSFSYLVETPGGMVVVDLGWNSEEGWQAFLSGLSHAGKSIDDVRGVVITHVHPDHYGLAERIRAASSAWIAVHPAEYPQIASDSAAAVRRVDDMARWLQACGAPQVEIEQLRDEAADITANVPRVQPDVELADGVEIPGTDGSLVALHTPGHTPGSVCFVDQERKLLFTGDHVLPRVTPNVSKRPTSDPDPLLDFTNSLHRLASIDMAGSQLVLPGHEWAFNDLSERLVELEGHHEDRLEEILQVVEQGCNTVWEVAENVRWSRQFDSLAPRARRSAIGETYSHIYRLFAAGRLDLLPGAPQRWAIPATRAFAAGR